MRKSFKPMLGDAPHRLRLGFLAAAALPLAACAMSPYGYGYGNTGCGSYGTYNPVYGSIGALGYGSNFRQAAASSCANFASRYGGRVSVRNVQTLDSAHVKVFGWVDRGFRNEGWDCTFRSDGRITDFDL